MPAILDRENDECDLAGAPDEAAALMRVASAHIQLVRLVNRG